MDAEIRRLTYVQRYAGSKVWNGLAERALIGALPGTSPKNMAVGHLPNAAHVGLEARIIELESKGLETQKKHREELAAADQKAAETLARALEEQKNAIEQTCAEKIAATLSSFQDEQKRYFREAESAVVHLALAVAARVLHREAQLDPLLLRGAVRVALEDAQQGARCVLEVVHSEAEDWQRWLSTEAPSRLVDVRGREDVPPGHCRLEIEASAADLSVHSQLDEIERGFFDLLQSRQGTMAVPMGRGE